MAYPSPVANVAGWISWLMSLGGNLTKNFYVRIFNAYALTVQWSSQVVKGPLRDSEEAYFPPAVSRLTHM